MAGLLRAALYIPRDRARGPGVASADEDAFTLAAAVIEPLLAQPPETDRALGMELLGPFAAEADRGVRALFADPVEVAGSSERGAEGLAHALGRAEAAGAASRLVVLAELPSRELPSSGAVPGGDGAVGLLVGAGGVPLGAHLPGLLLEGSGLAAARALRRALDMFDPPISWLGEWSNPSRNEGSVAAVKPPAPAANLDAVSEGAYVPLPRYLENLPSRWRFVAEECPACGTTTFPARGRCRRCGKRESLRPRELPREDALVVATTVIGPGGQPTEFDPQVAAEGPYEVVLAEIAPGQRVTLQLTDAEPGSVRIGDRVDTRLRRLYPMEGEWRYGRKAVPRPRRPAGSP